MSSHEARPLQAIRPPVARREPRVTSLHGEERVDDYAWLRDKANPEVAAYLEAENQYTDARMAATEPLQRALYDEMLARIQETDVSAPYPRDGWLYTWRTEKGLQYPVHCRRRESMAAPEQVVLDENALAAGHAFLDLGAFTISDDGNLLAYSTDVTGFREYTLQVKDLRTGELLPLRRERVVSVAWAGDGRSLLYTVEDDAKRPWRLYRHRLGEDDDLLLLEEPDILFRLVVGRSRSLAVLFAAAASHTTTEWSMAEAARPDGPWRVIAPRRHEHEYEPTHHGGHVYVRTNDRGRNFRLVRAPLATPGEAHWEEVVPHRDDVMLEGVEPFARHIVLCEREAGLPHFAVRDVASGATHRIAMPEPAYDAFPGPNAEFETDVFRYRYESLTTPMSDFEYDMAGRTAKLAKRAPVLGGYDPAQYATERLLAPAADGTAVPVDLVYRRDARAKGPQPLHLVGYGSYGYPLPIRFSSNRLSLLDRGVVCAYAHVRGGGELGKRWHDEGRMLKKPNTFTDFVAVALHLIAQGFTSQGRLSIEGGSAGGLLMGAVVNLRPDLFHAVVSKVPFVDVLNTMCDETLPLTAGEWEEWGDPRKPEEYACIRSYCPYTNLRAGDHPPFLLVKTSFHDSQVMYWEPAKYVARLRALGSRSELLLKTNMAAGHAGASGRYDTLREVAFDTAWLLARHGLVALGPEG